MANTVSSRDESFDSRDECLVSRGCWENCQCQLSEPFRIVHDWNEGFDIWNYVLNARGYVGKRENTRYARGVLMTFALSGLFLRWFFYCICSVYHQSSSRELPYHCNINAWAEEVSFEENQKSVCFGGELYFLSKRLHRNCQRIGHDQALIARSFSFLALRSLVTVKRLSMELSLGNIKIVLMSGLWVCLLYILRIYFLKKLWCSVGAD